MDKIKTLAVGLLLYKKATADPTKPYKAQILNTPTTTGFANANVGRGLQQAANQTNQMMNVPGLQTTTQVQADSASQMAQKAIADVDRKKRELSSADTLFAKPSV